MYGMVNRFMQDLVVSAHGEEVWLRIRQQAGVDVEHFLSNQAYADETTYQLVGAASEVLDTPVPDLLHAFGVHWILKTTQLHYGGLFAASGSTLREFLIQLPNFHARLQLMFPRFSPPAFAISDVTADSLVVNYSSHRQGLAPFVVGLLDGLGQYYKPPIRVSHLPQQSDAGAAASFLVTWL